jgi:hypothetical protein
MSSTTRSCGEPLHHICDMHTDVPTAAPPASTPAKQRHGKTHMCGTAPLPLSSLLQP